jgi:alpha-D-xyloside xylohydrolase
MRVDLESESAINETHVPVPVSQWPARGVAALVDDLRPGAFDIGTERPDAVMATFTQGEPGPLSAHIYTADQPLDLSRKLAAITGLPAVPPIWAFAPQQWRNEHESSDEVRADANDMRALDVPGSVMWIDNPWQTAYNSFEFDETRFAGSAALIDELTGLGYKVLVWSTPYVNRDGPTAGEFREATEAGYLVRDDLGRPFVFPWQDGPGSLVDFTAPGATEFWRERIARATAVGVDGFKLDFGEDLVPELAQSLTPFRLHGGTPQTLHNAYAGLYHQAYLGALPEGDGFLITRAGALGEQTANTCIWPGDLDSDFSLHAVDNGDGEINVGGLPAAIAGGLSLSVSAYPFYGSDIGGFREGPPTTETLIRWAEYAALGTVMQLGGGGDNHNPWDTDLYGPEALPIYRTYARLHMDLLPFLYTLALAAGADGTPVTVPTRFLFPESASDDATFVVGEALFVAPVITEGATEREVILPPGQWVDFWTGELVEGDGSSAITRDAPLDILPLWQRVDRIVPMYTLEADTAVPASSPGVRSYADPAFGRELTWRLAPGDAGASAATYDGASATAAAVDAETYAIDLAAGDQFDVFTAELYATPAAPDALSATSEIRLDGAPLPEVTAAELETCALPGCWVDDGDVLKIRASAGRLEIR